MKKFHIIPLLLAGSLLWACENEIAFRGEQSAQKMVLNALITAGEPIEARLTNSVFFLSNDDIDYITDATMTLYVDGAPREQMVAKKITPERPEYTDNPEFAPESPQFKEPAEPSYDPYWVYQASYTPKEGDRIRIEVTAPGFEGTASAEISVPMRADITKVDYTMSGIKESEWGKFKNVALKIHLADPSEERNFYKMYVGGVLHFTDVEGVRRDCWGDVNYTDAVFQRPSPIIEITDQTDYLENTFTDDLFDGSDDYAIMVSFDAYIHNEPAPDTDFEVGYSISIQQLSESYYNFLKAIDKYSPDNFLAEPVQVYNNVTGGIGVVAAQTAYTLKLNYYNNTIYSEDQ